MKFQPQEFQQATIDWVKEQLFAPGRASSRFLVADEVGLGKTIVTAALVDEIRNKARKTAKIVYLTSSLDIARQNCQKLASDAEIIEADRILLAFDKSLLDLPRRRARGEAISKEERDRKIELYSFTPGTSIFIKKLTGTVQERRFLALLCMKYFGVSLGKAVRLFCHVKDEDGFRRELKFDYGLRFSMSLELKRALIDSWRGTSIRIAGEEISFQDLLQLRLSEQSSRELVKELRSSLARLLLANLNPRLIIVDEFQRCHGLVEWPVRSECAAFFNPRVPTLLLSATPYALAPSMSIKVGSHDGSQHYKDFGKVLKFLYNEERTPNRVIEDLGNYGKAVLKNDGKTIERLLEEKARVERQLQTVMTRTERALFETEASKPDANFLSTWASEQGEPTYSVSSLAEFLVLRDAVPHPSIMMNYWKSGAYPRTYMQDYDEVKKAQWSKIKDLRSLRTDPSTDGVQSNIKLRYLVSDCLKGGENFQYLWVPPSRSYYPGKGAFDPKVLQARKVKKALVFSVWSFVPKFIATEVAMMKVRQQTGKSISQLDGSKHTVIKPSTVNWLRFYYPSRLLSSCLTHRDFVTAGDTKVLFKTAKKSLRDILHARLGDSAFKGTGVGSRAWQVIKRVEIEQDGLWERAGRLYRPGGRNAEQVFATKDYQHLMEPQDKIYISERTLDELAQIAIASPSVCLYRALKTLMPGKLKDGELEIDEFVQLMRLCIHEVRTFINRHGTFDAVKSAIKRKSSPAARMEEYFLQGNIQAVLDEYLYLQQPNKKSRKFKGYLDALKLVWGPLKNYSLVQARGQAKKLRVPTDIAVAFSGGDQESDTRDNIRLAFNSPFWPFILGTTSIGQEGLDFHLYCRDIYHWDLPTNPVAFEQREGRINRHNNLNVRRAIADNIPVDQMAGVAHIWEYLFREAQNHCHAADRYNFGLSPHWIFTPPNALKETNRIQRHILDLPLSKDKLKYEKLMTDIVHYRLALGQPNQRQFLEELAKQNKFSAEEIKGLTLQLFPRQKRKRTEKVQELVQSDQKVRQLLHDAKSYLEALKRHKDHRALQIVVWPLCKEIQDVLDGKQKRTRQFEAAVKKLYYFVDPHDDLPDFIPNLGFSDDLARMRKSG